MDLCSSLLVLVEGVASATYLNDNKKSVIQTVFVFEKLVLLLLFFAHAHAASPGVISTRRALNPCSRTDG